MNKLKGIALLVMIQVFYCTNTCEYTNIRSCRGKLVFDSSRLQERIFVYTLVNSKIELTSLIHEKILKCMNVMCVECLSDCHLYHIHKCSYYVVIFANYPKL